MPNHFTLTFFLLRRRDVSCSHSNRDLFTCEDNMLFSHVKISCFRAKAHLVFHWYLYNKVGYFRPLLSHSPWSLVPHQHYDNFKMFFFPQKLLQTKFAVNSCTFFFTIPSFIVPLKGSIYSYTPVAHLII